MLQPNAAAELLIGRLKKGVDGIYGSIVANSLQSVEVEMRERDSASIHENLMDHVARHHSVEVMDFEIARFLRNIPADGVIIDIGGCWGWHWRTLRSTRPDIVVFIVDFVRSNLLRAHEILGESIGSNVHLVHSDATALDFPDSVFDGVWTTQTFQHIPIFAKAVAEAHRVLKGGGVFCNYSLNIQPHLMAARRLLGRRADVEGWVSGHFWLAYSSSKQRRIIDGIFRSNVSERWSEIIFTPELRLSAPGREGSWLGRFDALLSNNVGFLGWFARQRSFHCKKIDGTETQVAGSDFSTS